MLSADGEPVGGEGGEEGAALPTTVEELRSYRALLAEDIRRGRTEAQRIATRLDQAERVLAHIDATISTRSSADGSAAPSPTIAPAPAQDAPEASPAPSSLDAFLEAIPIAASIPLRKRGEVAAAANGAAKATAVEPAKAP